MTDPQTHARAAQEFRPRRVRTDRRPAPRLTGGWWIFPWACVGLMLWAACVAALAVALS